MAKSESQILAEQIYTIENAGFQQREDWMRMNISKWTIADGVHLEVSDDRMMWYLWKYNPDQPRAFFKAVPRLFYKKADIAKILNAQRWVCI